MQKMPKKMTRLRRYSTVFLLATLCLALTSCGTLIGSFEYTTTYNRFETDSSCNETGWPVPVSYATRDGYFSRLSTDQAVSALPLPPPFTVNYGSAFTGELHLPFVGSDCSWYYSYEQCEGFSWSNFVPFSGNLGSGPMTLNIDFTKNGVRYAGQIHLRYATAFGEGMFTGTAYMTDVWLDQSLESSITSYDGEACDQKIVFTSFKGTRYVRD
jgi:hypothetical protein